MVLRGKNILLFALLLFVTSSFVMAGCDKLLPKNKKPAPVAPTPAQPVAKGTPVAIINNHTITLEDLNEEIASYNNMVPEDKPESKISTREQKIDYLKNQMVRKIFLYQEALDRGIDRKEEVAKAMERTKQDLLVLELVRQEAEKAEVLSSEVEDYYNKFKEELKEPEERRIREIGLLTEQEARDVLIQLLQGADFEAVAREKSKLSSAQSGGDLGFISKGKGNKSPQFYEAAFSDALEAGKTSNIFKGGDGYYYVLKLEAKRGGAVKTLNEMWDDIKRGLTYLKQQQRIEELVGKISSKSRLEIREGEIK